MKVDLHNHTVKLLNNKNLENFYLKIVKKHGLDAFAITNYHDIESAVRFKKKFPQHVIVGCEYRVFENDAHLYIVVLGVTPQIHNLLMQARFRGLEYFTSLLKKHSLAYFWARIGWGFSEDFQKTAKLIEAFVLHFDAIETLTSITTRGTLFATKLAKYYNLASIGGSDTIISESGCRAFTKAKTASSEEEFLQAILAKKVSVGFTNDFPNVNSMWGMTKNFYQKEIQKLWKSKFISGEEKGLGGVVYHLAEAGLTSTLHWIPKATYLNRLSIQEKKILQLERFFVQHLKAQETQKIFKEDKPLVEKQQQWKHSISKITRCFS